MQDHQQQPEDSLPSEAGIRSVVHSFYSKIREDDLLAPVFESRLNGRWTPHLEKMVDFWSSVLLATSRYRGQPLVVHGQVGQITPEMWSRWLELFAKTSREQCTEFAATLFIQRSEQIAGHLSRRLNTKES